MHTRSMRGLLKLKAIHKGVADSVNRPISVGHTFKQAWHRNRSRTKSAPTARVAPRMARPAARRVTLVAHILRYLVCWTLCNRLLAQAVQDAYGAAHANAWKPQRCQWRMCMGQTAQQALRTAGCGAGPLQVRIRHHDACHRGRFVVAWAGGAATPPQGILSLAGISLAAILGNTPCMTDLSKLPDALRRARD